MSQGSCPADFWDAQNSSTPSSALPFTVQPQQMSNFTIFPESVDRVVDGRSEVQFRGIALSEWRSQPRPESLIPFPFPFPMTNLPAWGYHGDRIFLFLNTECSKRGLGEHSVYQCGFRKPESLPFHTPDQPTLIKFMVSLYISPPRGGIFPSVKDPTPLPQPLPRSESHST